MKLLIGGSPCTHWSIAQTKNRETEASGIGWELFLNYRIARDKYKPDYFLYENNKSMSPAIRAQITAELGVEPVLINSALVSAQNRQRLYWAGKRNQDGTYSQVCVEQPEDRGILLRDILETGIAWQEKSYCIAATEYKGSNPQQTLSKHRRTMVAEPIIVNGMESGKARTVDAHMGKFENNLVPRINNPNQAKQQYDCIAEPVRIGTIESKAKNTESILVVTAAGKSVPVYEVRNGKIAIKGKEYPIKLADGFYIIRKLTVRECMRLQTVPDTYVFPVSDTQAYKMLGNGWTVDVIAHIMGHFDGLTKEPVEVLSMYDGMSCGHIALDKLGAEITAYYATEIDKYAIQTTQRNFPDTVQLGDAFQVRDDDWVEELGWRNYERYKPRKCAT